MHPNVIFLRKRQQRIELCLEPLTYGTWIRTPTATYRAIVCALGLGAGVSEANDPIDLGALGAGGFRIDGIDPSDVSGFSVSGAGDVNGDGLDDVIVGASRADPDGNN